jgi:hypothetical protein
VHLAALYRVRNCLEYFSQVRFVSLKTSIFLLHSLHWMLFSSSDHESSFCLSFCKMFPVSVGIGMGRARGARVQNPTVSVPQRTTAISMNAQARPFPTPEPVNSVRSRFLCSKYLRHSAHSSLLDR